MIGWPELITIICSIGVLTTIVLLALLIRLLIRRR